MCLDGSCNHNKVETDKKQLRTMAVDATLHCLVGCSIGEILGLVIGTIIGLSNGNSIILSVVLSFMFGYALSTLPLVKSGLNLKKALALVLAADTLSIFVMELVDNTIMASIPGAMNANLVNPLFWITMPLSLIAGFIVAVPVNQHLLERGKGHALTHGQHAH